MLWLIKWKKVSIDSMSIFLFEVSLSVVELKLVKVAVFWFTRHASDWRVAQGGILGRGVALLHPLIEVGRGVAVEVGPWGL